MNFFTVPSFDNKNENPGFNFSKPISFNGNDKKKPSTPLNMNFFGNGPASNPKKIGFSFPFKDNPSQNGERKKKVQLKITKSPLFSKLPPEPVFKPPQFLPKVAPKTPSPKTPSKPKEIIDKEKLHQKKRRELPFSVPKHKPIAKKNSSPSFSTPKKPIVRKKPSPRPIIQKPIEESVNVNEKTDSEGDVVMQDKPIENNPSQKKRFISLEKIRNRNDQKRKPIRKIIKPQVEPFTPPQKKPKTRPSVVPLEQTKPNPNSTQRKIIESEENIRKSIEREEKIFEAIEAETLQKTESAAQIEKECSKMNEEMENFLENLQEMHVKIQLQNNRILMLNDPRIRIAIDEIKEKYQNFLNE